MASLRDIKRRIASVKSTRQITKAMKMVSAAKLRRAQSRMTEARPYSRKIAEMLSGLASSVSRDAHPLLAVRDVSKATVIVITADRGLCGSFNTNALKAADRLVAKLASEGKSVNVVAVGKKIKAHLKRKGAVPRAEWEGLSGKVDYSVAATIARDAVVDFEEGVTDEVYIIFNEFKSVATQNVVSKKILPLDTSAGHDASDMPDFLFEPSVEGILGNLLPRYVNVQVLQGLLENQAAEEAARMSAMENATKAASDMIGALTLAYNKARQAAITGELMDIIGGAEAVKQ
ncbi:MAG: ATP synthase F1 subunit gamma [Nitrospirae bacterium]|nr:ATP synthase F1 subunit gamma [Nitrospirota bacterium]